MWFSNMKTKGSNSFINVRLKDLNRCFKEDMVIKVSKKQMKEMGILEGLEITELNEPENQPEVKVEQL
jgi:hypothetical protein